MVSSFVRIAVSAPKWMDSAGVKCKHMTDFFYPNKPSADVSKAKALCNGLDGGPPCAFRNICLRHAIDNHEAYGVWGGSSERDRRRIQRARNKYSNRWIYTLEDVKFPNVVIITKRVVGTSGRLVKTGRGIIS